VGVAVGVAMGVAVGVGAIPPQTGQEVFASLTHVLSHSVVQQNSSNPQMVASQVGSSQPVVP
jgi:hypothetical protein